MAYRLKIPDVQDKLAALIAAELPDGVPFDIGYPDKGPAHDHVWIDGAFETNLPTYLSGGRLRDETGEVRVVVSVNRKIGPMTLLRDRAFELVGAIEDALDGDRTLGGIVESGAFVTKVSGLYALPEDQRHFYMTVTVSYDAPASG